MDHRALASELIRGLRAHRSQRGLSRRLGYTTNVVYTWEAGLRFPTAAETFRVAARVGIDPGGALRRFQPDASPSGAGFDLASPEGVAALLRAMAGRIRTVELAARSGFSRHAVGRWLTGRTQPRLPQFLTLIEAITLRLPDFLSCFVEPAGLPSLVEAWRDLEARRALARELPWSQAVLRCLELGAYERLPGHRRGWIADRLGIGPEEEERCLEALVSSGQVVWDGDRYRAEAVVTVDTRQDPEAGRRMRRHWGQVALERIDAGRSGQFSYNVMSVSRADLERIREMHLAYFRAVRSLVADSDPCERVVVLNLQLFELDR
jgi:transcriptional regulator with XRE-family HTH domain